MSRKSRTLDMDEDVISALASERKKLTALWYLKMSGQVDWIDEGEKANFEREFARLEREIRIQDYLSDPHGYLAEGDEGLEKLMNDLGMKDLIGSNK